MKTGMVVILVAGLALAAFGALSGCRSTHLGDETGVRVKQAFRMQAKKAGEPVAPMDAIDAFRVLDAHRRPNPPPAPAAAETEAR